MHLICLGVMKKLINLWLGKGPVNSRIPSWKCKTLTKSLLQLKTCITRDFCRKPRPIQDVCRWKATEFRQFLLYTGPIVLEEILNEECYNNFLALHISMRILLSDNNQQLLHYTHNLLKYFVKSFQYIYGAHFISHNVHGILHLCDDYERHGPLDTCSTFPFENYMKVLKKMLHKNEKPLQQVIRRYNELCKNESIQPISHNERKYSNQKPDCFILTNSNEIVQIIELIKSSDKTTVLIGKIFEEKKDLFIKPLKSSILNIFVINRLSEHLKQ